MAENHDTRTHAPEKPTSSEKKRLERFADWLAAFLKSGRPLLGLALVGAIGYISLRFNYELGKLSAVDDVSGQLLPAGYALLDICALFLSGLIGMKAHSAWCKGFAWLWFGFLVSLSLWAAASFTLSIDARLENKPLADEVARQKVVVDGLAVNVTTWQKNVDQAVKFKTKHQNTLNGIQAKFLDESEKLSALENQITPPAMSIYNTAAPLMGLTPDNLNLFVRLLWSAALTLSPLVLGLLGWAAWEERKPPEDKPKKKAPLLSTIRNTSGTWKENAIKWNRQRKARSFMKKHARPSAPVAIEERETPSTLRKNSGNVGTFPTLHSVKTANTNISPIKGHNMHTQGADMNGLRYAREWLEGQPQGRIKREKLAFASKIKGREGVNKIIKVLLEEGVLDRHKNGQLYKPENVNNPLYVATTGH